MKLDKSKVIAILLEEAKKDPTILMKVVELLPTLIAVYERITSEAKSESPKVPANPNAPAPSGDAIEPFCWLENAFHDWYTDGPDTSDMTTTEEVVAIVKGEARVPPGASLWLMSNSPDALWCFRLDEGRVITFAQKDETKVWTGPAHEVFVGARYKQQPDGAKDARHVMAQLLVLNGPHTLTFWVKSGELTSPEVSIPLGGRKV